MSERGEAKRDGARLQKNSGRGKIQKGDAIWNDFVVDYKEYERTINISSDMWMKICMDTFKVDRSKHPLIKVIFNNGTRLAIIEWSLFEEMEESWRNQ